MLNLSRFFVSTASTLFLGAIAVSSAASATPLAVKTIAPIGVQARHRVMADRVRTASAGTCTTVNISAALSADLEEPATTATVAYVIPGPGTYTQLNIDGTGCDIAVYVPQGTTGVSITDSVIHDGTRAGIAADASVGTRINGVTVYNIGWHAPTYAPNGVQYGFAILAEGAKNFTATNDSVYLYQKEGFSVFDSTGNVSNDIATGAGELPYIASNGFDVENDKFTSFAANKTELNQYSGPIYGAAGYIVCGVSIDGILLNSRLTPLFETLLGNSSLFDDIDYYIDANANCS
jgi:hypothetical protein